MEIIKSQCRPLYYILESLIFIVIKTVEKSQVVARAGLPHSTTEPDSFGLSESYQDRVCRAAWFLTSRLKKFSFHFPPCT